jgi:hypothetical protein
MHRVEHSPWWFSSDGSGRFDPVGTGAGGCYFAERPLGSWVEVFRKQMLIPEAEVEARCLFTVATGRDLKLADVASRRALSFGVTAAVGADERYGESQRFAIAAVEAGVDGVRYLVRHDPAQKLYGIALFAAAGDGGPAWPAGSSVAIPDELVAEAARLFRYRVLPTP